MSIRRMILLVVFIHLYGCSNTPEKMGLIKTSQGKRFVLKETIVNKRMGGIPKRVITTTIKGGKYNSSYVDDNGTYFNGPAFCWASEREGNHAITAHCGIYIPNNESKAFKLFYYTNSVKRVSDNKPGIEIVEDFMGPGGAAMVLAFDPAIAFEIELDNSVRNKIKW
ncbi:MAG: hypothetical protein ABW148_16980 [Sedimenticola sp.]